MSEREKEIITSIIEGLPKMSDFEKGYVLGVIEGKVNKKEQKISLSKEEETKVTF